MGGSTKKIIGKVFDPLGLFSSPDLPKAEATATPTLTPTQDQREADNATSLQAAEERRRRQAAGSPAILTSGQGAVGAVNTAKKTLLG